MSLDTFPQQNSGLVLPALKLYKNALQTIAHGTATPLTWQLSGFAKAGFPVPSFPVSLIAIPITGIWLITAIIVFAGNATGSRDVYFHNTGVGVNPVNGVRYAANPLGAGYQTDVNLSCLHQMNAGENLEVVASQTSGGPLDVLLGDGGVGIQTSVSLVLVST